MSSTILFKYKILAIKLFKHFLITACLILILLSFPLATLAAQNNKLPTQKEGVTNEFNNYEDCSTHVVVNNTEFYNYNSGFSIGIILGAGLGGLTSVGLVSISGKRNDLSASGISSGLSTVGKILGGGMKMGLFASAALPVMVIYGGVFCLNSIFNIAHFLFQLHIQLPQLLPALYLY